MTTGFSILPLGELTSAISVIADWFRKEWPDWYGPGGNGNAAADLESWCRKDALPLAWVAISADGQPVGVAALKSDGKGAEHGFGPFLSALYVHREFRRRGIGRLLTQAIENAAKDLSYPALYCTTGVVKGMLESRGWIDTGYGSFTERGKLPIYRLVL